MSVKTPASENRDFPEEIKEVPFRGIRAEEMLRELGIVE